MFLFTHLRKMNRSFVYSSWCLSWYDFLINLQVRIHTHEQEIMRVVVLSCMIILFCFFAFLNKKNKIFGCVFIVWSWLSEMWNNQWILSFWKSHINWINLWNPLLAVVNILKGMHSFKVIGGRKQTLIQSLIQFFIHYIN